MAETATTRFIVEVAYALPERQLLVAVEVADGTTAAEAVALSGIAARVAGLDAASAPLGIFGKAVLGDQRLRAGDRVEVLRPLLADPKEVRRALAAEGKTMGKPREGGGR